MLIGASGLELLMVLALMALVTMSIAGGPWRVELPGAAAALARYIVAARTTATVNGHAVSVGPGPCSEIAAAELPHQVAAMIVAFSAKGLLFTPDGLPRTCDGGGVGNTTILLEYRGRQAAVIVSSLGRVRWEPR
jgi:hypothetical protein